MVGSLHAVMTERRFSGLEEKVRILADVVAALERDLDKLVDDTNENVFLLNDRIEKLTRRISDLENGVRF